MYGVHPDSGCDYSFNRSQIVGRPEPGEYLAEYRHFTSNLSVMILFSSQLSCRATQS
jgi:hypothetical protein